MKLHLGVMDLPYQPDDNGRVDMTGAVAQDLEDRYHVVEFFVGEHGQEVADDATQAYLDWIDPDINRNLDANQTLSETPEVFRRFLENKEMDGKINGVPTLASLQGKSLRFKNKRGPVRPSFIDTGMYSNSFMAWIEK